MKISALEVEEAVLTMPGIKKAALVPLPDPRLGERACLVLVVEPDQVPSLDVVCRHLHGHGLAKFKWPEALVIREELPLTPTGKVSKAILCQQMGWSGRTPNDRAEKMECPAHGS